MQKNIFFNLAFFIVACSLKASHYMGLDVYYDYLGNQKYRIIIKAYGDCASTLGVNPLPNAGGLTFSLQGQGGGCTTPVQIGSWQLLSYQEVTPICPGYPTKCNTSGASLDGVREAVFQGIFDFSGMNCTKYNIVVNDCCRNNAITNVTSPGSRYIYSNVTIIDLTIPNSSPRFTQLPTPYICYNQPFSFNQGAVDPDGDSLVYRIDYCQGGTTAGTASAPVTYIPPATNTEPIISNPPMFIDPVTGDIFMTPSAIQTAIMCVFVDEYRNGVLIGTIERDIQVKVINCGANRVPQLTGITEDPNQPTYQFVDTICAGVPATLYITSQDSNLGQFLTLTWNNGIPAASFSSTPGFNAYGILTWNNPIASSQPYTFIVRVQDDYCPINGYRDYTFQLYVQGGPFVGRDSIGSVVCNDVEFIALIDSAGVPPFSFEWSGDGNLSFNIFRFDSTFSHSYPGPGTYHYTLTITDALGCKEIISDSVTIINASIADAGKDTTICNNVPITIGTPGLPHYTYRWRPGSFLSDSTVAQPVLTYLNTSPNPVTVTYQVIATDTLTGCSASDFVNITVKPEIITFIAGPSSICLGDSAILTAPLSASYNWSTGDTVQVIKVGPTDTTIYTLITTDFDGCPTTPATLTINVIPPIQAEITGQDTICQGDSTLLTCSPSTTYLWSTGQTTQSIWVKPNVTTSYWVKTTNSGCNGLPDTFTVVVNPIPSINIQKNTHVACQQQTVTIYYEGNASAQSSFNWSITNGTILNYNTRGDTITAAFDSTGVQFIYLTVTDKGCVAKDTQQIFINPTPKVTAGPDTTFCKGTAVYTLHAQILTGTSCQYFWSPSYGLDNPNALNPNAFPDTTTTYYFYAVCNGCTSAVDTVVVTVPPRPVVQITNPLISLCSGDTAQLMTQVLEGTAPFTYQWIPAFGLSDSTSPNPLVFTNVDTTYRLIVRDSANCFTDTLLAQVTVTPSPIVDAGDNDTLCKGQGTFLQPSVAGNGSFQFQWSPTTGLSNPNIANPFVIPNATTTYYLQVTSNLTGCVSDVDSVTIVVLDLQPPFAGNDTAICVGESVQIGSAPVPGRQYFWTPTNGLSNPNISNPIASPSFTTTYTLQYTENGCLSIADEITVTVLGRPTVDAGDSVETCPGVPVQLQANASGVPGPYTFTWYPTTGLDNPNAQNPIASPSITTKYYVYAAAQGCSGNIDSVIVYVKDAPTVDADTTDSTYHICQGDTVWLAGKILSSPQPVYLHWWGKDPTHTAWLSDTTIANPYVVPQVSATYYFQAEAGGCLSNLDSVLIRVTPKLNIQKFPQEAILCKGIQTPIGISNIPPGAVVVWSYLNQTFISNDSILLVQPDTNTTYVVHVVHEVCEHWDTIYAKVYPQPKALFRAGFNESCNALEVSFRDLSQDAVFWMWDFGDGSPVSNEQNPVHIYTQPGTYTVTLRVQGYGACKDSSVYQETFTVKEGVKAMFSSEPMPPVQMILPQTTVQFRDSSQNAVAWLWDFGDGYTSTEQNPSHQYLRIGQYFVNLQVIDTSGCVQEYALGPYIVIEPTVQVYNVFTPNGDGINDYFRIPYDGHDSYEFMVYDRWGILLYSTTNPQDKGWNGMMPNGKPAVEGVYFYSLKIGNNLQNGSFTLMK